MLYYRPHIVAATLAAPFTARGRRVWAQDPLRGSQLLAQGQAQKQLEVNEQGRATGEGL